MNYAYGSLKVKVTEIWNLESAVDKLNEEGKIVVDAKCGYNERVIILYKEDYHNNELKKAETP